MPSTVSLVEGIDVRFIWDCSLWERVQAGLLLVLHSYELRLNTSVVVRISSLVETYTRVQSDRAANPTLRKGGKHTELSAILVCPRKHVGCLGGRSSDSPNVRICLGDAGQESVESDCDVESGGQALGVSRPLPVPGLQDIAERENWGKSVTLSMGG